MYFCEDKQKVVGLLAQGRNEGGQGGFTSRGAKSLWGRCRKNFFYNIGGSGRITAGGAEKSQQYHKYFLQYSEFASETAQVGRWGAKLGFCPGCHVTSLRPCIRIPPWRPSRTTSGTLTTVWEPLHSLLLDGTFMRRTTDLEKNCTWTDCFISLSVTTIADTFLHKCNVWAHDQLPALWRNTRKKHTSQATFHSSQNP